MNHKLIAKALCGQYREVGPGHGYIESFLPMPLDGSLLGAHVIDSGAGRITITDDGDTLFHAAVAGAEMKASQVSAYRQFAANFGIQLNGDGELTVECDEAKAEFWISSLIRAAEQIARASVKHRIKDVDRFSLLVGEALREAFPKCVTKNFDVLGVSGHQLRFPFALNVDPNRGTPTIIQTVAARDERLDWGEVYKAGGKFLDVREAGAKFRRVSIMEPANDEAMPQARTYLAACSDVIVFSGSEGLRLALSA